MLWRIKALGQRVLAVVPGGDRLYYAIQKNLGGFKNLSVSNKVSQGIALLEVLNATGYSVNEKKTLEIGTGRMPVIPMLFYILGQQSCDTFDIDVLLKGDLTLETVKQMTELSRFLAEHLPWGWDENAGTRLEKLKSVREIAQLFDLMHMKYHAPADARNTRFPPQCMDVVFSNTTLEHIPSEQLLGLLQETRRVLLPDGVMVHLIDCSDHFSHSDPNISRINFLRFSDDDWQKYNTKFIYQSRLRAGEYRRLIEQAGFKILIWDTRISPQLKSSPPRFTLDRRFADMDFNDVCITTVKVVACP